MTIILHIALPIVMILFPAVFSLFVRGKAASGEDGAERAATARRLQKRLFAWTAAALALFSLLRWVGPIGGTAVADLMWIAFFPLWFQGAMPLLQARDVSWQARPSAGPTRSASLVRRDAASPALRRARFAAWVAWSVLALATIAILARSAAPQWWLLSFTAVGACELVAGIFFARLASIEPEPLGPAGSHELEAAYASLRRLKQWGWYWGTAIGMLLFAVPALLVAWSEADNLTTAIWIGAGGGGLLGTAGGIIGVVTDLKRARINRRYRELTATA